MDKTDKEPGEHGYDGHKPGEHPTQATKAATDGAGHPVKTDGHSDFPNHDYTKPAEGAVKPDQPSNAPGGITGAGINPPKSSGAGVDPVEHVIDEETGLTATGSDNPGGEGFTTTPLAPGETATLGHYTMESGAVASTPVPQGMKHDADMAHAKKVLGEE